MLKSERSRVVGELHTELVGDMHGCMLAFEGPFFFIYSNSTFGGCGGGLCSLSDEVPDFHFGVLS
jgi:hypothetical protein